MPSRILRDGLLYSPRINGLSEVAELTFLRLLVVADDFGLAEAHPQTLKGRCFPLRDVPLNEIERRLNELEAAQAIRRYTVDGRALLAIERWDQRRYTIKPKYPAPPWGWTHIRGGYVDPRVKEREKRKSHSAPTVRTHTRVKELRKEVEKLERVRARETATASNGRKRPLSPNFTLSPAMRIWAKQHGHTRLEERFQVFTAKARANGYRYSDWDAAFRTSVMQDWAGFNPKDRDPPDPPGYINGLRISNPDPDSP